MKFIVSLLFCSLITLCAHSKNNVEQEQKLKAFYENQTDPIKQAFALLDLVKYYDETNVQSSKEDCFLKAIEKLRSHGTTEDILKAYSIYFDCLSDNTVSTTYLNHAQDLIIIANNCNDIKCQAEAHTVLSRAYLLNGKIKESVEQGYKANSYAKGNSLLSFGSLISLGNALIRDHKPIEAFNAFWDANLIAIHENNDSLSVLSNNEISNFYAVIEGLDSAKSYKLKQIALLKKADHKIDSNYFMKLQMELAGIEFKLNLPNEAEKKLHDVIAYADKQNLGTLKSIAFQFFRNHYIETENLEGITKLYKKYDLELKRIRLEDTTLYYRIQAFMYDANKNNDSAKVYYSKSIELLQTDNPYLLRFMQFNYAKFLTKIGIQQESIDYFKLAFNQGLDKSDLPFLIKVTSKLDSLYVQQSMYDSAYHYQKLHEQYSLEWLETTRSDEILRQSIFKESEKREILSKREHEKHERVRFIEYTALILILLILFVLLGFLGSIRVSKTLIKITNFVVFIFLFELIILVIEEAAYSYLHGSPLKMLTFRILVVGALSPLHHWMEEKVLHYFSTHKLIDTSKINVRMWLKSMFTKKISNPTKADEAMTDEANASED